MVGEYGPWRSTRTFSCISSISHRKKSATDTLLISGERGLDRRTISVSDCQKVLTHCIYLNATDSPFSLCNGFLKSLSGGSAGQNQEYTTLFNAFR